MDFNLPSDVSIKNVLQIRKYVYLPVITAIVVVGLLVFVIVPNVRKVSLLRKEVGLAKEELASLEEKSEILAGFDEAELLEQVELLERTLPSKKDVFGLLVALNGLAAENGVALGNFQVNPGSIATESATGSATARTTQPTPRGVPARGGRSDLESLAVSVEVTGPFAGVRTFLSGVERLRPLMKLTSVSYAPPSRRFVSQVATVSASLVIARLELNLFYANLPTQIGAAGQPISKMSEADLQLYDELITYSSHEASIPASLVTGKEDLFSLF